MLGKTASGAPGSPIKKGKSTKDSAYGRKKPAQPKSPAPLQRATKSLPAKLPKAPELKEQVSTQGSKSTEKPGLQQEIEPDGGVSIENTEIPIQSVEDDEDALNLVDNTAIPERDEASGEQRGDDGEEPPQASGSTGKSYFQRGKDAASGLASFANKANKLHSQLPESLKQQAANHLQTGMRRITTMKEPAADEEAGRVEDITQTPTAISNDLSSLSGLKVGESGLVLDGAGNEIGRLVEGDAEDLAGQTIGTDGEVLDEDGDLIGRVELLGGDNLKSENLEEHIIQDVPGLKDLANLPLEEDGTVKDQNDRVLGKLVEGNIEDLVGWTADENGEVLDEDGDMVGRVELLPFDEVSETLNRKSDTLPDSSIVKGEADDAMATQQEATQEVEDDLLILDGLQVNEEGLITDANGSVVGELESGDPSKAWRMTVNAKGLVLDEDGNIVGKARLAAKDHPEVTEESDELEHATQELPPLSTLQGLKCNKFGNIVNEDGVPIGELVEGDPKSLSRNGAELDEEGQFWDNRGNIIGKAQTLPISDEQENGPFADLDEPYVAKEGWVLDADGSKVGQVVEGEIRKLLGRAVDDDGDILDKYGNLLGRAEPWEEPEPEPEETIDLTEAEGLAPNKIGNVIGPDGVPIAKVSEGDPKLLVGKSIDAQGQIWGDHGEVIGRVSLIPEEEREAVTLFGGTGDLIVRKTGFVEDETGDIVGKIVEGDPQKLNGLLVDDDGDILDKRGNVKGRAEPYNPLEEEEEEEEKEDISVLEGMSVNKLGNIVDENGSVWGRLISGNPKKLAGKQVDAEGQIWSDDGKVLGLVELVPSSEREQGEGVFYGLEGLMVTKEGTITDPSGQIVGKLVEGDVLRLIGRAVDEDGEIIDKVGNVIGRAERWVPEEKPIDINPMSGRKVNREGEVRDEDGNLIGKLTEGNLKSLAGKTVDNNGYLVDNDGNKIGECTLLEHLPEPEAEPEQLEPEEPELSPEELEKQEKEERDRELAKKMSSIIQQTFDSVEPLCKQIDEHIERADRTPRDELDEDQLVKTVKPIIEEAGNKLQECKGALRALDPDGQIAASAKARSVSHEATPEEYQLADLLKQLSQTISTTIENGRRRIADMPHAKKKINPLWSILSEPLFQIIAAVGLLLSGVLGLLGNLLNGLGLGNLVSGLLGGLGIDNLLGGLGLGNIGQKLGM